MSLFRWRSEPAVPPILLRLDMRGRACPASVEVEAEWKPSRTRAREHLLSASSMVLVPWRRDASEAVLSVRAGALVGRAVVTRESNRDGSVLELRMTREERADERELSAGGVRPRPARA